MTFHPDSLPDLTGTTYVVTGGNSGIGYGTVARLAQHGAHVYLCARSLSRASDATAQITSLYPYANITLLEMDHLSLQTVVSAAKLVLSKETTLHGLINNAGIMATPFGMSGDGHEEQWQTNYLAHWVFTSHLLPLLLKTSQGLPPGSVRVVNLSSSGHYYAPNGGINFDNTSLQHESGMARYGQSKLGNILHGKMLNKCYGPGSQHAEGGKGEIWTAIVHPGLVESQLGAKAEIVKPLRMIFAMFGFMGARFDNDKGAWTSLFCAASPQMKANQSGTYFQRIAEAGRESAIAKDMKLAERLYQWTKEIMKKEGWVE
ncbi:hypothetical protein ACHAPX_010177 [Trichoderma viride]